MEIEPFQSILSQIKPYARAVTLHVMGEPLAHPLFPHFLEKLEQAQIPLLLTTNGLLLSRHQATLLKHASIIKQINFSVHSFFDNFPSKDITNYLSQLIEFSYAFTKTNPESFINFRLWNLQSSQQNNNIPIFSFLQDRFPSPQLPSQVNVREQKSYRLDRHIKLHFDTQFEWPTLNSKANESHGFCYGLQNQLAILTEGTVVPCCLDKEGVINLGSLFETPLEKILQSPRAQAIIQGFKKNQSTETLCQKCQYKQRFNT